MCAPLINIALLKHGALRPSKLFFKIKEIHISTLSKCLSLLLYSVIPRVYILPKSLTDFPSSVHLSLSITWCCWLLLISVSTFHESLIYFLSLPLWLMFLNFLSLVLYIQICTMSLRILPFVSFYCLFNFLLGQLIHIYPYFLVKLLHTVITLELTSYTQNTLQYWRFICSDIYSASQLGCLTGDSNLIE